MNYTVSLVYFLFCLWNLYFLLCNSLPTERLSRLTMCQIQQNNKTNASTSVFCKVSKGQILDYRDIRDWSANTKDGKFSVHVNCDGGLVYLPWPFKARNVESLEVQTCTVLGFFTEMTLELNIPDELKTLILTDVTIEIPLSKMLELRNDINHVVRSADCGQLTLETLIFKRIHYDLKMSPEERDNMHLQAPFVGSDSSHVILQEPCVYRHLKFLDESGSRRSGQYHLKLVPEHSQFPALEVYNMSGNEMDHVPETFRHLHSGKFPALRHIDFSRNFLRRFEFDFPKDPHTCRLEIVDLHDNMIDSVSPETSRQLSNLDNILVDMRQNPLICDCRLLPFRQYLDVQYRKTTDIMKRQLISTISCKSGQSLQERLVDVPLLNVVLYKQCNR